jgi:general secretion pathway protein G
MKRLGGKGRGHKAEAGFTLMEMLVVLVVIGLIAAVAVPQVMKLLGSAKHKAAKIQIETLSNSLNAYQLDMGSYPTTAEGLKVLWKNDDAPDWAGPYVRREKQLVDPWGRPFVYAAPGKTGAYDLITLGADGREGGRGDDADLSAAD